MRLVQRIFSLLTSFGVLTLPMGVLADETGYYPTLYAPHPPAGSSYVRVVSLVPGTLSVMIGTGATRSVGPIEMSTAYRVIPEGKSVSINIDGVTYGPLTLASDTFDTIVFRGKSAARPVAVVRDADAGGDGLLANLAVYNLTASCQVQVVLPSGPVVFDAVAPGSTKARQINPVSAQLVPKCNGKAGAAFTVPKLNPRDHYSLFVVDDSKGARIVGHLDTTEPYK